MTRRISAKILPPHRLAATVALMIVTAFMGPAVLGIEQAQLVKDINTKANTFSYTPTNLCEVNGKLFFALRDRMHGNELWVSDDSGAGVRLVKDINPSGDSNPYSLVGMGDTLYFVANDGGHGTRLWKSDGTAAGTKMVKDTSLGGMGYVVDLAPANGWLYFAVVDQDNNRALWRTDGTEANTLKVKNVYPYVHGSVESSMVFANGNLFFAAISAQHGTELWKSDGTDAGTVMVKDIAAGADGSYPVSLTVVGNIVYFTAQTASFGFELWRTDGTSAGTVLVKDIKPGTASAAFGQNMVGFKGALYFSVGQRLWKSGGTAATTAEFKDGTGRTIDSVGTLAATSTSLFAIGVATTSPTNQTYAGLWRTDGTPAGSLMLTGLPGSNQYDCPGNLHVSGSGVQFTRLNYVASHWISELWKSDGTLGGTVKLSDIPSPTFPSAISAHKFFIGINGSAQEVWKTNGTTVGTVFVASLAMGTASSTPTNLPLASYQNRVLFAADNGTNGNELWTTDGTEAGTVLVKDINTAPGQSSYPGNFVAMGGALYFEANSGLWKTNGTTVGTTLVANTQYNSPLALLGGNKLLFAAQDTRTQGNVGIELYITDGSPAGMGLVKDIYTGPQSSSPAYFAVMNGNLLFNAADGQHYGGGLYKTDGTDAGTEFVSSPANISTSAVVGSMLYFVRTNSSESQLWKTDGSAGGTVLVKTIQTTSYSSIYSLMAMGNTLVFSASDDAHGYELWKSDGTAEGTVMIKDIAPGISSSGPSGFVAAGDHLFFVANDLVHGNELWITDGTDWGTHMVADIMPGPVSSAPAPVMVDGGVLYFRASDEDNGMGLWRSDGTAAGTYKAALPSEGLDDWKPRTMVAAGGKLFVVADTMPYGEELFTITQPSFTTLASTHVTSTSAILNGNVDPGGKATTAEFQYGLTSSYGSVAPITLSPADGVGFQIVSAAINGLQPGTTYHFRIVADNGVSQQVTEDAEFSTAPSLDSLTLSGGVLTPSFDSLTTSYTVTVPYTTASLQVAAVIKGANSTVAVNGAAFGSGVNSPAVSLSPGLNDVRVVVTAQDGVTSRTYHLAVTRTLPVDGTLALESAAYSVGENDGHATVRIVRSGGVDNAISVNFSMKNGTALAQSDYSAFSGLITFDQGESLKTIYIPIIASPAAEPNKTFSVMLSTNGIASGAAVLGAISTTTVVIVDPTSSTTVGDTLPPAAPSIAVPIANAVLPRPLSGTVTIAGVATDNKGVHQVSISVNDEGYIDAVLAAPNAASTGYSLAVTPASSRNTIRVKSYDLAGRVSAITTRTFTVTRELVVNFVGPDGAGTVTSGFVPSSFREPGKPVTITATAKPGFVFDGWSVNDSTGTGITPLKQEIPTLTFIMQPGLVLTANFVENPFVNFVGAHEGLLHASNGTAPSNSTEGRLTVTVQSNGAFTGSMMIDGLTLPCSGQFDNSGVARFGTDRAKTTLLPRPGKTGLTLALQLDFRADYINIGKVRGTVSDIVGAIVSSSSVIDADACTYDGRTPDTTVPDQYLDVNSAGQLLKSGTFAFFIPAGDLSAQPSGYTPHDYPQGAGFGLMTITKAGAVTLAGTLADGTAFSSVGKLAAHLDYPWVTTCVFAQLYNKQGFLGARLELLNVSGICMVSNDVRWCRPPLPGQYYPRGWPSPIHATLETSKTAIVPDTSALGININQGHKNTPLPFALSLSGGDLANPITKHFTIISSEAITKIPANDPSFTLSVVHSTGTFSGSFIGLDGNKRVFGGATTLLGNNPGSNGFFLSPAPATINGLGESGSVRIVPE